MTSSSPSSRIVFVLLANLALAAGAGCGVFGADEPAASSEPELPTPDRKAREVTGPADTSELTDELGVFVASNGLAHADGTHGHPLLGIQAGIDKAKTVGKRVYVCAGTYKEALVIADSISVIGGLDCSANEWRAGTGRTRIEAPSSPAVLAKEIISATRLERLDIVAPDATKPSGSSIGLLAEHASALVVAGSKITAGAGAKGDDGREGAQLSNGPSANGRSVPASIRCDIGGPCERSVVAPHDWLLPSGGKAGGNTCVGAPGIVAESGSAGGSGGLFEVFLRKGNTAVTLEAYKSGFEPRNAEPRTSAAGANGQDGTTPASLGTISGEGYTPADGTDGQNGSTGFGGAGGNGLYPYGQQAGAVGEVWRGWSGAGGGAGGCPGLAGTAGKGGGASIAALVVQSPLTFDGTELVSGRGGDGGRGSFGSVPTAGGLPGYNARFADLPALSATGGGRGGVAGISGNGASGPSVVIAHAGPAPTRVGATKLTVGAGGAGIAARSRTDAFGNTKVIPGTPQGLSKETVAF
jgi:hypothetical protein